MLEKLSLLIFLIRRSSMIVLIAGSTHTGKTLLAQRLLERYKWPYLSIDHLKMGLIRSGQTPLTPEDDPELTVYLWPILREIIKTAVENKQNLIVEGIYIPPSWRKDFEEEYLRDIRYVCLVMTRGYIEGHRDCILKHAGDIEERLEDSVCWEELIRENEENLRLCRELGERVLLIDGEYRVDFEV